MYMYISKLNTFSTKKRKLFIFRKYKSLYVRSSLPKYDFNVKLMTLPSYDFLV